jgi:hypothetical protein
MGPLENLADTAGVPIRRIGGLRLVRAEDAPMLLDEARRARIGVLGAEGFRVTHDTVTPEPNAILDLSDLDDVEKSHREARAFVDAIAAPQLLLELVLRI